MKKKYLIFLIIILSLLLRLIVRWAIGFDDISVSDGYEIIAEHFLKTGKFENPSTSLVAERAPLFPCLVIIVYYFFGVNAIYVQLLNIFMSVLSVLLVYVLSKQIVNELFGYLAAIIMAINPLLIGMSSDLMTENLFMFLIMLHTLFILKYWKRKQIRDLLYSALLLGLATLTRPVGLLYWIFWSLILLYFVIRKVINLKHPVFFIGFFLLVLSPWTIRNYFLLGKLIPVSSYSGRVLWESNNPYILDDKIKWGRNIAAEDSPESKPILQLPEIDRDKAYRDLAINYLMNNPSDIPKLIFNKHLRFWNLFPDLDNKFISVMVSFYFLPQLALFIFGMIKGIVNKNISILILVIMVILMNISALIYWGGGRIRMPVEPFVIITAVYGLVNILNRFGFHYIEMPDS